MEDVRQVLQEKSQRRENAADAGELEPTPLLQPAQKRTEGKRGKAGKATHVERRPASIRDILGFDPSCMRDDSSHGGHGRSEIPSKWHRYFDALIRMQDDLAERLWQHRTETLRQGERGTVDRANALGQHCTDGAMAEIDLERALSSVENEQELLREVQDALERMRRGTYGICEQTGEAIDQERLNAIPFARYSLRGQEEYERNRRAAAPTRAPLFAAGDEDGGDPLVGPNGDGEE
jgi:RNA polymerase-binding transcription factor DksA